MDIDTSTCAWKVVRIRVAGSQVRGVGDGWVCES